MGDAQPEDAPEWVAIFAQSAAKAAESFLARRCEMEGVYRVRVRNRHGVILDLRVRAEYAMAFDSCADGSYRDPGYWDRDRLARSWDFHNQTALTQVEAA